MLSILFFFVRNLEDLEDLEDLHIPLYENSQFVTGL